MPYNEKKEDERFKKPVSIMDAYLQSVRFEKLRKKMSEFEVHFFFSDLFPAFKDNVEAVRITKGTLYLSSTSSVWKNEIMFQQQEIITKLNESMGEGTIKRIKFI